MNLIRFPVTGRYSTFVIFEFFVIVLFDKILNLSKLMLFVSVLSYIAIFSSPNWCCLSFKKGSKTFVKSFPAFRGKENDTWD